MGSKRPWSHKELREKQKERDRHGYKLKESDKDAVHSNISRDRQNQVRYCSLIISSCISRHNKPSPPSLYAGLVYFVSRDKF